MRVTKTIREFIEKEVSNRLDAKYTAEKEEADFQTKGGTRSVGSGYGCRTESL